MEREGRVAAGLIGYPLPDRPEPIPDTMPPMFVPLQQLENLAPGTWYVNVLAAYPRDRGQAAARRCWRSPSKWRLPPGAAGLSIIVSDTNTGARRLYERCGYREAARRAKIKEDWRNHGVAWVLLTKSL